MACPVPSQRVSNPEMEMIVPAVKGTSNVLKACSVAKVKRVVMTSSIAAVSVDPNWAVDKLADESCWSDVEYCKASQNWYCMSKTLAEQEAWQYSMETGLDLVTVCPSLVWGPMLHPTINASSFVLIKLLNGDLETCENKSRMIVDVRDLAKAHLLTYENHTVIGRYICSAHPIKTNELVDILKRLYPQYTYPKYYVDIGLQAQVYGQVSSAKLRDLGLEFMPLEKTLVDTIECFQKKSILK